MYRMPITALATIAAAFAAATPITIYDTGVDDSGNQLAGGSPDPHYTCVDLNGPAHVLSDANTWPTWLEPTDAKWIAPLDVFEQDPTGWYTIQTTFDLTGLDPSTSRISGFWAADQYGSMYLNGNLVATVYDGNWNGNLTPFELTGGFVAGVNTLSFTIMYPDGADGLVVSGIHGEDGVVPEPASALVLGIGAGLAALAKRRRR